MTDDIHKAEMAIEASESSLREATAHIERAAEKNDDPAVAKELHGAAIAADSTTARVGWLRATLSRLFRRQSA
jgi:Tfp pilus assembly protein PilX